MQIFIIIYTEGIYIYTYDWIFIVCSACKFYDVNDHPKQTHVQKRISSSFSNWIEDEEHLNFYYYDMLYKHGMYHVCTSTATVATAITRRNSAKHFQTAEAEQNLYRYIHIYGGNKNNTVTIPCDVKYEWHRVHVDLNSWRSSFEYKNAKEGKSLCFKCI